jgi:hypothetical protein
MGVGADRINQGEAVRLAESIELFGFKGRLLDKLETGDYRNALMLVRRAMAGEQEHFATHFLAQPRVEHMQMRHQLLQLLEIVNSLRLQIRTTARA